MCPRCNSTNVTRSRRWRFRDVLMRLWGMRPYRCHDCRKRFYLPSGLARNISNARERQHGKRRRRRSKSSQPRSAA